MEHEQHVPQAFLHSAVVVLCALVATLGFHLFIYGYVTGVPLAIFTALLVVIIHALTIVSGKRGNMWAYVFLLPVLLGMVAESVYAGETAQIVGLLTILVSFACFTFWYASPPVRLRDVPWLLPPALFFESLLPLEGFTKLFSPLARGGERRWKPILLGVLAALPFLLVLGALFIDADALLQKTLSDLFVGFSAETLLQRLITDGIALIFFLGAGWTLMTRLREDRRAVINGGERKLEPTATATFLALLNLLFLAFIGFQLVYFFGGASVVQQHGITYANYARQGFFQLLAVSAIVLALVGGLYLFHAVRQRAARILMVMLILETGIVIASAVRRMQLYIDAYGLSLLRYWAVAGILFIAVALAVTLAGMLAKMSFSTWFKTLFIGGLLALTALNVMDAEAYIARTNVDRFLSGATRSIDLTYLSSLSSDAVPELVRLLKAPWPVEQISSPAYEDGKGSLTTPQDLRKMLLDRREKLKGQFSDWRNIVLSDYRALAALSTIE